MSNAMEWDFTVPDSDTELLDALHERGVVPGLRLHMALLDSNLSGGHDVPEFFASFDGDADLSERSRDVLRRDFPFRK